MEGERVGEEQEEGCVSVSELCVGETQRLEKLSKRFKTAVTAA